MKIITPHRTITTNELDRIYDVIFHIIQDELEKFGLSPSNVAILGYSVGVKGDIGLHGWTVAFGATKLGDDSIDLSWDLLKKIEQRVTREIQEVTRVLYEIPHKENIDKLFKGQNYEIKTFINIRNVSQI